jgi:uncharacterized membrane protein
MRGRLYWLATAFFLCLAIHSAYLLFAPGFALGRNIKASGVVIGSPDFRILSLTDQTKLFPTYPKSSVFGLCAYDVTKGEAKISAAMPDGFWALTIYSNTGKVIYALNSAQSGTGTFTVSLRRAPSLIDSLLKTSADDITSQDGWNVATVEPKGIVVMWMPLREAAQRAGAEKLLAGTRCDTVPDA